MGNILLVVFKGTGQGAAVFTGKAACCHLYEKKDLHSLFGILRLGVLIKKRMPAPADIRKDPILFFLPRSDLQEVAEFAEGAVSLVSEDAFCQDLAQLNAFLIEAVKVPCEALEHDLVLKVGEQRAEGFRG